MAHTAETIEIAGRKIKIAIGTYGNQTPGLTRTVNVFDQSNRDGYYSEVYRLPDTTNVTASSVQLNATSLDELDLYLDSLGATKEGPRTP